MINPNTLFIPVIFLSVKISLVVLFLRLEIHAQRKDSKSFNRNLESNLR